jgi:para-aminobenzoate synthetase component II
MNEVIIMILMIDNYDSFTFNLVQYIQQLGENIIVKKNNEITIDEIKSMRPTAIILSPGPGNPNQAGISLSVVEQFYKSIPILGVCLGHQVIGQFFGGKIVKAKQPMHGKTSSINHDGKTIFKGLKNPLKVTRYHSLIIQKSSLPNCLQISACSEDNEIMAIRHKVYPIEGVQFHPESILTECGLNLLQNFFKEIRREKNDG